MNTSRKTRKRISERSPSRCDPYQVVTEIVLRHLENGTAPWRRPWNNAVGRPRNFHTGNPYQGINVLLLGWSEYASPHWLTVRQANRLGGRVRKGEKGTRIVKYGTYQHRQEPESTDDTEERETRYYLREYAVFNAHQIEGIAFPDLETSEPLQESVRSEAAETIVASMPRKPVIVEGKSVRAVYCLKTDTVEMPAFERFETSDGYHLTLFHELIHATGHPSRLNRKSLIESGPFGSKTYSKEELVAEMGAAFLGMEVDIVADDFEQSAAYLKGWLEVLREPNLKRWIVQAAGQATKAVKFIRGDRE